jgi:hypothetical protein
LQTAGDSDPGDSIAARQKTEVNTVTRLTSANAFVKRALASSDTAELNGLQANMLRVATKGGLGIRRSIVRYGNPRLLLEYPAYVRARRATGASGRVLVFLPEEIYGDEAIAQNRRSAIARHARRELQRAWNRILGDLFAKLTDGRLVAYGSLDSSLNPKELIKATAWNHLELSGLRE